MAAILEKLNNVKQSEDRILYMKEVSEMLDIDIKTARKWCDEGKIKSHLLPNGYRCVFESDLLDVLKENKR